MYCAELMTLYLFRYNSAFYAFVCTELRIITYSKSTVPGQLRIAVTFNFEPTAVICLFGGGEPENCSLPLRFNVAQFGLDSHTVVVTVFDVSGKYLTLTEHFQLEEREFPMHN